MSNLIAPRREAIIESNGAGTARLQEWMEAVTRMLNEVIVTIEIEVDGDASANIQGMLSKINKRLCDLEGEV